jgi:hypothetical protein
MSNAPRHPPAEILIVENILCILKTVVAARRPIVVLRLPFDIGNTSADEGDFYACTGKIRGSLLELIYPGIIEPLRLRINCCRLFRNNDITQKQ